MSAVQQSIIAGFNVNIFAPPPPGEPGPIWNKLIGTSLEVLDAGGRIGHYVKIRPILTGGFYKADLELVFPYMMRMGYHGQYDKLELFLYNEAGFWPDDDDVIIKLYTSATDYFYTQINLPWLALWGNWFRVELSLGVEYTSEWGFEEGLWTRMNDPDWLNISSMGFYTAWTGADVLHYISVDGIKFTNAFTIAPVCSPNRSCIITGIYPATLGTHHMRAGGEGTQRSNKPKLPPYIKCFSEYLRKEGYYCTNNYKEDYNFEPPDSAWDESSSKAHWRSRIEKNQPFFAVFNYTNTHEFSVRLNDEDHAKRTERLIPEQRQDPEKMTLPPYYPDTPLTRLHWAHYYELITVLDYWVADILKQLEEDEAADNTIVFFWSDHGTGFAHAKRWPRDSGLHVPLIVRIPEKFRISGQGRPGTVDDRLINSVDFAETALNLAGVKIPDYMQGQPFLGKNIPTEKQYVFGGRDRMDERYDIIRTVRSKRFRYIRNYMPFEPYYQYIQSAESGPFTKELRRVHKLGKLNPSAEQFMTANKPVEELYDLENDPHEINNLAEKPEYREVLDSMWTAHVEWMIETKDLGLIPEPELVEIEKKYGNRYAFQSQPGSKKLLRRIHAVAALAGKPVRSDRPMLIEALKDRNAAVRYWAAIGIGNLCLEAEPLTASLYKALNDKSAIVRVAAAGALCALNIETDALPVLISELKSQQEWVRLNAAIVLDSIGGKARPAIDAFKEALEDTENKYVVRVANHALNVLLGTSNKVR